MYFNLKKNILRGVSATIISSSYSALLALAVVPFYLRYLGLDSYGLIGFFVSLQSLLLLLELGLTPAVTKRIARLCSSEAIGRSGRFIYTVSIVYWLFGLAVFTVVFFLAPVIASSWLSSEVIETETIERAITLTGLVIALKTPIGFYNGVLVGAERLICIASLNALSVTLSTFGSVLVLVFVAPTLEVYLLCQIFVGFSHLFLLRYSTNKLLTKPVDNTFVFSEIEAVCKFATKVGIVGVIGLVLSQLDRVILSKILSLSDFAVYVLAKVVASVLYIIIIPVFQAIYARMSAQSLFDLSSKGVFRFYKIGSYIFASVLFSITAVLVFYSDFLVYLWTGDLILADDSAPIISLLAIGVCLHGVMHFPYALQLASGEVGIAIRTNALLLFVTIPFTIVFALNYGGIGGALSWLFVQFLYLIVGTVLTHRTLMLGYGTRWLMFDIGIPLAIVAGTSTLIFWCFSGVEMASPTKVVLLMLHFCLCVALSIFALKEVRLTISNMFKRADVD